MTAVPNRQLAVPNNNALDIENIEYPKGQSHSKHLADIFFISKMLKLVRIYEKHNQMYANGKAFYDIQIMRDGEKFDTLTSLDGRIY